MAPSQPYRPRTAEVIAEDERLLKSLITTVEEHDASNALAEHYLGIPSGVDLSPDARAQLEALRNDDLETLFDLVDIMHRAKTAHGARQQRERTEDLTTEAEE